MASHLEMDRVSVFIQCIRYFMSGSTTLIIRIFFFFFTTHVCRIRRIYFLFTI
ncbi:hypothetical protein IscW_ISCW011733 [Ixodes scapularis]|uniref:Uncharacterized protein n=1 Tax=Ixodes scapularis TaxID=6945 RepID=B7Q6G6_IXOSC|nr:hypothetical protein IscW_ISCW011733 [Ixodes scapularis]|eukprot:XP_002411958.1 hypothetical protein IscW_ISCW011733 [Ixodes scapularis]